MNITNNFNLPTPLVNAISNFQGEHRQGDGRYSVTQVLAPYQVTHLRRQHASERVQDASDCLWMLLGHAVHAILERSGGSKCKSEVYMEHDKLPICGTADVIYYPAEGYEAHLMDFKVTSTWAVKDDMKKEWETQLNIYKWLASPRYTVGPMYICAVLRDWVRSKAKYDETYPQIPFVQLPVNDWGLDVTQEFVEERLELLHQIANGNPVPPCTDEERWFRPGKYAVMKGKNKRAVKLHDSEMDAKTHAMQLNGDAAAEGPHWVECRPGVNARCEGNYCGVAEFCPQWSKLKEESNA